MIGFNGWNWYLALVGYTSIEFWAARLDPSDPRRVNAYNNALYGNRSLGRNIEITFGTKNILRILLPNTKKLIDVKLLDDV